MTTSEHSTRTSPRTGPAADGAAIRLSGLHKSFGSVRAVRGIDLTVAPGEVVAFLGPNGAGKSTTIDLLLGLTKPDSGTARLFGGVPDAAVSAGRVGAMLQSGALLPDLTVRELIRIFAALHRNPMPVGEAMLRAGIDDIAGQKTQNLSGGQAQRVRFALALVPDPDVVVLDEPTVAMDVEVRRQFWASMREFAAGGRTVLFATHYLQEADDYADRVVVIADGRIIADGTGASIKARVSGRTLSAVIPGASEQLLRAMDTVTDVEVVGGRYAVHCDDSDAVLRLLLARYPQIHDIEITQANLEQAFLQLTGSSSVDAPSTSAAKGA
ncbi:ABC transporter ATP-binding protein [Nakamurella lactea]|uniref:ABC transporter ATP-binding protein n=1 Tax=Nakamurella lactea TaxID=459515 RepID=UPI000687C14B|nr:ABC transporter ATP-binding protein [Nakamurella lactea]